MRRWPPRFYMDRGVSTLRAYEWKLGLSLALLVMILMRLVWMDLRTYIISFAPESHFAFEQAEPLDTCARSFEQRIPHKDPGLHQSAHRPGWVNSWAFHIMVDMSCKSGAFGIPGFIRYNQGLLISTLLILMLLTRILTHSWIVALASAVALLSRGRLVAALGQIGADHLIAMGLAVWGISLAHWLRSGSPWLMAAYYLSIAWLVPLEPGFTFLAFVLPLLLWYGQRYGWERIGGEEHSQNLGSDLFYTRWWPWRDLMAAQSSRAAALDREGGIFRPVPGGIARLWQQGGFVRRTWIFVGSGVMLVLGELFILTFLQRNFLLAPSFAWRPDHVRAWLSAWLNPIDRDLGIAMIGLLCVLLMRTSWLLGLRSLILATTLGIIFSSFGSLIGDLLFLPGEAIAFYMAPRILLWWEALILGLGLLSLYQILLEFLPRYLLQRGAKRLLGRKRREEP